jgi:hypothetical protein
MTPSQISPSDREAIERLFNLIAGRIDGLIDMGTLVCLGQLPVDRQTFLARRLDEVRELITTLRQVVGVDGTQDPQMLAPLLSGMVAVEESLRDAFVVLEQFRSLPAEAVHLATRAIANGYRGIRVQIQCLGHALGIPVLYWEGERAKREDYYKKILDGLYDLCCRERASEPATAHTP